MNSFIKSLMDEFNVSQKDLSAIVGVSPAAISSWRETNRISLDNLLCLSRLFNVTVDELLNEQRSGETIEDKWAREYIYSEDVVSDAIINGEKETVLHYLSALHMINERFFDLLYKDMTGTISEIEVKEFNYIKELDAFKCDLRKCRFYDKFFIGSFNSIIRELSVCLESKIGLVNKDAIVWELKKIFQIKTYDLEVGEFSVRYIGKDRDDIIDTFNDPYLFDCIEEDEDSQSGNSLAVNSSAKICASCGRMLSFLAHDSLKW